MKQFVLIDQSLADYGGHHYEYAERVLAAAKDAGYEPILAANRKCRDAASETAQVYPVYQHGYWYRLEKPRALLVVERVVSKLSYWGAVGLTWLLFSTLGLSWANRRQPGEYWRRAWSFSSARERAYLLTLLIGMAWLNAAIRVGRAMVCLVFGIVPLRAWLGHCGRTAGTLCRNLFWSPSEFRRRSSALVRWMASYRKARCFQRDTLRLLDHLAVTLEDVFFIPNIEENEMLGLLQALRRHPSAASASWHLLFRRNLYTGRPAQYARQDEAQRPLRNRIRWFNEQTKDQRVFFYTDTQQLSEQYRRLGVGDFKPLPVPVEIPNSPARRGADARIANIVYIGDAREEKGYQHLPRLVQDLWRDYLGPGRARCTFQSNYNTASGENAVVIARHQLADYPADKVRLLLEPLAPAAYHDLLRTADVALLPYDRDNYFARSSGVFSEAIAAGVPVVVPAGSWMAVQFAATVARYHDQLFDDPQIRRETVDGPRLSWRTAGRKRRLALDDGTLSLGGESSYSCTLTVPEGARYLLLRMRQDCHHLGALVRVDVRRALADSPPNTCRARQVIGGVADATASALFNVEGADRLRVTLRSAFGEYAQTLSEIEFHFLHTANALPLGAVGISYDSPDDISRAVAEVLNHLPHYQRTAADLSASWSARHHPRALVAALAGRASRDTTPLDHVCMAPSAGAGRDCRLSLRERAPFRGAEGDFAHASATSEHR